MKTTIDKAGRIVVPKRIRDRLALRGGEQLDIDEDNGRIEITRAEASGGLVRSQHGLLTFSGGPGLSAEEVREEIEKMREEREARWT